MTDKTTALPDRIWAVFLPHEQGGLPRTYATAEKTKGAEYVRATQLSEALDRAAECEGSLNNLLTALNFHTGENHGIMAIRHLVDRATTAKAALEGARKVIDSFAEYAKEYRDDEADTTKMPVRIGHLRALNAWLSANPEVKA